MQLTAKDLAARFQVDQSTIHDWRLRGVLPTPANPERRRGFLWNAADIERWQALGMPGADVSVVEENIGVLADDLALVADCPSVHQYLRDLARTGSDALRCLAVDIRTRLGLAQVFLVTNWFADLPVDGVEELRVLRARMRILSIVRDAEGGR